MSLIFCYSSEHIDRLICHLFPWYHKKVRNSYHIVCQIRSFSYTWRSEKVRFFQAPCSTHNLQTQIKKMLCYLLAYTYFLSVFLWDFFTLCINAVRCTMSNWAYVHVNHHSAEIFVPRSNEAVNKIWISH